METVLLTGANGFIGRYVTALLEQEYHVHKMTEDLFTTELSGYMEKVKPDYLIHLAWVTGQGYADSPKNLMFVQKSLELYHAFYLHGGKRAVFIGTEQEYERRDAPLLETDALAPESLYAECKADLGRMLVKASRIYGYGFVWCRLFFVYGAGEKEARLMPSIIRGLLNNETVYCSYEGFVRDYLAVEDVARAIVCCLFSDYTGAVNVAGGENTTIGRIAEILQKEIGGTGRVECKPLSECNQPLCVRGDISLLRSLGFEKSMTLAEGLQKEAWLLKEAAHAK